MNFLDVNLNRVVLLNTHKFLQLFYRFLCFFPKKTIMSFAETVFFSNFFVQLQTSLYNKPICNSIFLKFLTPKLQSDAHVVSVL